MNERNTSPQEALVPNALPLGTAQHAEMRRWLRWLTQALSLPSDWVSFTLFAIVVAVLSGGLILHIHLSAQIYQTQLEIDQLALVHDEIAHQNTELIWQISQFTSLNTIYRRAEAMGYIPATQQYYVSQSSVPTPGEITLAAPQAAVTNAAPGTQTLPPSAAGTTGNTITGDTLPDQTTLVAHDLLMGNSHAPAWPVRVQQRMARVGSWMQSWWQ